MRSYSLKVSFTTLYLLLLTAYLVFSFFAASQNYCLYTNYAALFIGLVGFLYERSGKTRSAYVQAIMLAVVFYAIFCYLSSSLVTASIILRTTRGRLISTLSLSAHMFFVVAFFRDSKAITFERILYCLGIVYVVMTFATYSFGDLMEGFSGERRLGGDLNGINMFGMSLAMIALFAFYKFMTDPHGRTINILLFAVLTFLSLTSSSRKAMLGIIVGVAVLFLMTKSGSKLAGTVKVVLIIGVAMYLLSVLDITSGVFERLSTLWSDTDETVAESDEFRADLIRAALEGWAKKPLFGNGFNTFTLLNTHQGTYAHNNFAEMLFNVGLVGTLLYYYPKVLILVSFFKSRCYRTDYFAAYLMTVCLILLAFDMGCVSYYYTDINYMWWFAGAYAIGHRTRAEKQAEQQAEQQISDAPQEA